MNNLEYKIFKIKMIKPSGKIYIFDLIFYSYQEAEDWINLMLKRMVDDRYSTYYHAKFVIIGGFENE